MILSIFLNETTSHLIELFFWLLGAFLIGLYFGKLIAKKKSTNSIVDHFSEDESDLKEDNPQIRATKTFERGGKKMIITVPIKETSNTELDFSIIGKVDKDSKNNLKKIKGIGALIEGKLNTIGIFNYNQINNLTESEILKITEILKLIPGRIERENWVIQAKELLNKK